MYILCKIQVMFMVLQCLLIVLQIEIGIAHLAVDGTQRSQVARTTLDRRLKEIDTFTTVTLLAVTLAFQSQLETCSLGILSRHQT